LGVHNPFQLYEIKLNLTESELHALSMTIRNTVPNNKFIENLIMKIYDEVEEKLKEIKKNE
jgi:hypothetical protein